MISIQEFTSLTRKRGYRIVNRDDKGKLVTLRGWPVKTKIGRTELHTPTHNKSVGLYLGTSKEFVTDHYTGMSEHKDVLLTYEYDVKDVIKGSAHEDNIEIIVTKAKLVAVEDL